MSDTPAITIPSDLLPGDGRFGSGPSKVRVEALEDLAATGTTFMGTSHRQPRVRDIVARMQDGMREFFSLPDDWEVIIGNGGATLLWDALSFGFIEQRAQHLSFGEFSSKFAACTTAAPHLDDPMIVSSDTGSRPEMVADDSIDVYAYPHNETSTGVSVPVHRPEGATGLVAVDATSGAGGLRWNSDDCDLYYFAPQKCFAGDGGLFLALAGPAAVDRIESVKASGRWIPAGLDLGTALDNSRKNQTYNTPALATIFLTMHSTEWMNSLGGLEWAATSCDDKAAHIYGWADAHELTTPFVSDPSMRSHVVATIDFDDSVDADVIAKVLRANGIVDTEGYRKLGRNQLRLSMFPAIDTDDSKALTACIDHVLGELA
ncbi:MAG: phosphoserine transaminase [Actinomycetota bacterium]